jgi:hypothetical protein
MERLLGQFTAIERLNVLAVIEDRRKVGERRFMPNGTLIPDIAPSSLPQQVLP